MRKFITMWFACFSCLAVIAGSSVSQDVGSEVERLNSLTRQLYTENRFDEALDAARKALDLSERKLGAEHDLSITALNNLAKTCLALGKIDEAQRRYRTVVKIYEKKQNINPTKLADVLDSLGAIEQNIFRHYDKARGFYQQALTLRQTTVGSEHNDIMLSISNLIDVNMLDRDYKSAEPLLQRFIAAAEKRNDMTLEFAVALQSYEYLLLREKRQAEADKIETILSTLMLKATDNTIPRLPEEMIICRATHLELPDYPVMDTLGFVSIVVDVVIDETGKVIEARGSGSPNSFVVESIRAAKTSLFLPLAYGGQKQRYVGSLTYRFRKYRVAPETFNEPLGAEIKSGRCIPLTSFRPS